MPERKGTFIGEPAHQPAVKKRSLSTKLVTWFLFMALVPMLLVAWISHYQAISSLKQAAIDELEQAADLNVRFIQNWFDYRFMDIVFQAESQAHQHLLESLTEGFEESGQPLGDYVKSYDWARRVEGNHEDLVYLSQKYDYIYDIFLIDLEGNILYTVIHEDDFGTNLFHGPYSTTRFSNVVRDSMQKDMALFSDIERYAPSNGRMDGFISTPLVNEFGEKIGSLAVQIRLERLINFLQSDVASIHAEYYLVGLDGVLRSSIEGNESEVLERKIDTEQFVKWHNEHAEVAHEGYGSHKEFGADEEAFEYIGPNGNTVIGIHHTVNIFNVEWGLMSEIDKDLALASANWLTKITAAFVIAAGLLAIALAFAQARRITKPVARLAEATMAVAAGEMDQYVENDENDEIGRLAEAFNHMLLMRHTHEKALGHSHLEMQETLEKLEQQKQELLTAKDGAESAAHAKSEFLASMSHEIRTPMNGVLGMLGLLINSELNKEQHHQVTLARSSANSLLAVINDILDFSKIEAGKLDIETLDFNLRAMIGEFSEAIGHRSSEQNVELIFDVTEVEHSFVKGDPGRIRQILSNLVGNAIKFTPKGEVLVSISLKPEGEGDLRFYCTVRDTGIGIPANKIGRLFDSFTQVDASTTRQYGGSGLGLAIVKQLCEMMGGGIQVQSEEGVGSTFEFDLKLVESEPSEAVTPSVDIAGMPILIVDDSVNHLNVLSRQLSRWGAEVKLASNAEQAMALMACQLESKDQPLFQAVFLDMDMPDLSGTELGKMIRGDHRFDQSSLVMMTSLQNRGDAQFFASLGFSAYFPKPTTTSDLFDALEVIVEDSWDPKSNKQGNSHHPTGLSQVGIEQQSDALASKYQWPSNTRILLVEDNHVNQVVALALLDLFKLSADVVDSGLEAINSLQKAPENMPYSLILMDCQMPGMDGYEATKEIRAGVAGEAYAGITIMAMTANAMKGDREKCLEAGMTDYITKPIDTDTLEKKLYQYLIAGTEERDGLVQSSDGAEEICVEVDVSNNEQKVPSLDNNAGQNEGKESTSSELSVWDESGALKRVMGKEKILKVLIAAFATDMPKYIAALQSDIENRDIPASAKSAHALKGVAANLSAVALADAASRLERACLDNAELEQILEIKAEFMQLYPATVVLLEKWQESHA